ncbi:NF-X1-type zinc finger protein NFXL1-like [Sinocyclocheilus anshuiensis]|uniref:NF-X1-type zinc finger protein NFXL1-like n=1 Tax=Sinocyclocheilus anshuiensis TaxID=1608454 RepID=UPI0007B7FC3F|nr:PREDICTED: NF-X1-type zinc finger protein NFXL1-like [Sinocyclocheilus anshuiensis]
MDPAWRQRGRGRGQGRGQITANPSTARPPGAVGSEVRGASELKVSSQSRFEEIRKTDQSAAQRLATETHSSSSEDEDDVSEDGGKRGQILQSALSPYSSHTGDADIRLLEKTRHYLHEVCQSGGVTCLICIASVRRTQAVRLTDTLTHTHTHSQAYSCGCRYYFMFIKQFCRAPVCFIQCCVCSESVLPCTVDVPTCGDTCGKKLDCGLHTCSMRCHRGACETCRQEVEKTCRCGRYSKLLPCHKEYLCESKCNKTRACSRHQCKRKCCPGSCPPCDMSCTRMLGCRNHKCPSVCHQGSCYPCPEMVEVRCDCGSTVISVPCGREKSTRPLRCKQLCRKPALCHHSSQEQHRCHSGPCPLCKHVIWQTPAISARSSDIQMSGGECVTAGVKASQKISRGFLKVTLCRGLSWFLWSCPGGCLGDKVSPVPCHTRGPFSCGRSCGRTLACGNHSCSLECHHVTAVPNSDKTKASQECEQCEEVCSKPRPVGCTHPCALPCHHGNCPPCRLMVRQRCHCKISSLYIECVKFTSADEQGKHLLSSCQNQCPKQLGCGHRCKLLCHPDECDQSCSQRVKLKCPCKRIKKEFPCSRVRSEMDLVVCDETCRELQKKHAEACAAEERAALEEEMRKQQAELEAFEKRQKGRRKKNRKVTEVETEEGVWHRYKLRLLMPICGILLAVAAFCLLQLTNQETDSERTSAAS